MHESAPDQLLGKTVEPMLTLHRDGQPSTTLFSGRGRFPLDVPH